MKQYFLPIKGLSLGRKSFNYKIGNTFFEQFENSEIKQAKVDLILNVNKQSSFIALEFNLKGEILVQCDRCLDDFFFPVENKLSVFIKNGQEHDEQTEEMIILSENEHEFNIAPYIFEFINLSLPIKKVHGKDNNGNSLCNKEMLKKLSDYSTEKESKTDPRWDNLKNFI
ncbi:MAG: DUF177 domain-containing protein [Chlorobi bacterium]|nr:DUF177 domain-containing protein [Chlorobiota bacterium]